MYVATVYMCQQNTNKAGQINPFLLSLYNDDEQHLYGAIYLF